MKSLLAKPPGDLKSFSIEDGQAKSLNARFKQTWFLPSKEDGPKSREGLLYAKAGQIVLKSVLLSTSECTGLQVNQNLVIRA